MAQFDVYENLIPSFVSDIRFLTPNLFSMITGA